MQSRIQLLHTKYPHWGGHSGYPVFVRHLDPQRFHVALHGVPDTHESADLPRWMVPFLPGIKRPICRPGRMGWYKAPDLAAELEMRCRFARGEFDLIHFLDGEHTGQYLPRLIRECNASHVRTVATFHQPLGLTRNFVNRDLLRWFDAILLVSPSQRTYFEPFVPHDRIHVLLHGVDADFFRPAASPNRSTRIRCIIAGHHLRDWDTFRQVAAALKDITFDVVTGQHTDFDDLSNVTLHSGIDDAALAELYRSADILFLPLIDSTANNALLEGMASGLPVVTTDLAAARAYLPSNAGFLVSRNRSNDLVVALRKLQQDVDLRHEMGRQARLRACELAWPRLVREYESFYEAVLRRDATSGAIMVSGAFEALSKGSSTIPVPVAALDPLNDPLRDFHRRLEAGDYDGARASLESLIAYDAKDARVHAGLAEIAEAQWDWQSAFDEWSAFEMLMTDDKRAYATARKARCLLQIGEINEANAVYAGIRNQFEGSAGLAGVLDLQGECEAAGRAWQEVTILFPDRLGGFVGLASNLVEREKYEEAERLLSHALAVWPNSIDVGVLWANCPAMQRCFEDANVRWKSIESKHRDCRKIDAEYGRYLGAANEPESAEAHLSALSGHPLRRATFLAAYWHARDEYSRAANEMRDLVQHRRGRFADRLTLAALLMAQSSPESTDESLSILSELHGRSRNSVLVKTQLALANIRMGNFVEAHGLIQSLPAGDHRMEAALLRTWADHFEKGDQDSLAHWRTIFLDFRLFHECLPASWRAVLRGDPIAL